MHLRFIFIILFTLVFNWQASAQLDSIVLAADQLNFDDINKNKNIFDNQKVVSISKTLKEVSDLPFSIIIITKEEILQNNYTTLVDVLKMAPGIRISQPGSAIEGETFLMRGLKGNTYTKILINGSPIKPFGVISMPIGAQLPIRQAERIEIIYGPGAAIYGADANAGVINIIIEETKRPLNTIANLSIGTNGYSNVDVMFGGKFGKAKKVFNFNFYGSATSLNTRKNTYDRQILYDPATYSTTGNYLTNPNFKFSNGEIIVNNLPHESRQIGFSLRYKAFKIKAQLMARSDHSSIGLNPAAVSYANPLNLFGERIINTEISYAKTYKKFSFESRIGLIDYYINPQSTTDYVTNNLSEATDRVLQNIATDPTTNELDQVQYDSLSNDIYNTYFSGSRNSAGRSFESYFDQSFNVFLFKNLEWTLGGRFNFNTSVPQFNYNAVPVYFNATTTNIYDDELVSFLPRRFDILEASLYSQFYLSLKKLNFIGGMQYYTNTEFGRSINPRFAILYKPFKTLGIRAEYGEAFRSPSPFYNTNSYLVSSFAPQILSRANAPYVPEETTSYEFGVRWSPNKKVGIDVSWFSTKTQNLIRENFLENPSTPGELFYFLGYINFGDAEVTLRGIQSSFTFQKLLPKENLSLNLNFTYSKGTEKELVFNFQERVLKESPNAIFKARIFYKPFEKISITTDHIYMSAVRSRDGIPGIVFPYETRSFYTMDLLLRYELSRNFNMYFRLNNVFNAVYPGLNASNSLDDLIFNPQELRVFRLGMNYSLN